MAKEDANNEGVSACWTGTYNLPYKISWDLASAGLIQEES